MIVNFYLGTQATRGTDNPEYPIYIHIKAKHVDRVRTTIGISISPDKWDKAKQQVKNKQCNTAGLPAERINCILSEWKLRFLAMDDRRTRYTREDLIYEANTLKGKERDNFTDTSLLRVLYEDFKEKNKNRYWTPSTIAKYKTLINHIEAVQPKAQICHLNENLFKRFVDYLVDKGYKHEYIEKLCKVFKSFINLAIKNNYITDKIDTSALSPKLKKIERKVIWLEPEKELNRLIEFSLPSAPPIDLDLDDWFDPNDEWFNISPEEPPHFDEDEEEPWVPEEHTIISEEEFEELLKTSPPPASKQHLERVCDVFLFGCCTGLRYSDLQNLKRSNIKDNKIEIVTKKTSDRLIIPLIKYSKAVLDKYAGVDFKDDRALPTISNQKANKHLKELCRLCGINEKIPIEEMRGGERTDKVYEKWELISTHCARRTFICLAIQMGTPVPVIMSITGHKDYNAMKPYIAIASRAKQEAMNKFNALFTC